MKKRGRRLSTKTLWEVINKMTKSQVLQALKRIDKSLSNGPWLVPDMTQGCQSVFDSDGNELFFTHGYPDFPREGEALAKLRNLIPFIITELTKGD